MQRAKRSILKGNPGAIQIQLCNRTLLCRLYLSHTGEGTLNAHTLFGKEIKQRKVEILHRDAQRILHIRRERAIYSDILPIIAYKDILKTLGAICNLHKSGADTPPLLGKEKEGLLNSSGNAPLFINFARERKLRNICRIPLKRKRNICHIIQRINVKLPLCNPHTLQAYLP